MSQYPESAYWLIFTNESGLKLSRVKPIIQRWCVVEKRSLGELFEMSPLDLSTTFGLSENESQRVLTLRGKLEQQAAAVDKWQGQGIETVLSIDPRYPRRLAETLPPVQQPLVLWAQGALNLLNEPGVAMLGSQAPDEAGAELIQELMKTLVAEEINLVSGYSRGLDRSTFETMLTTAGGHAIAVLPMGLSAFAQTTSKLSKAVEAGQVVLVSPFAPDTAFQEKLAEARNLLIDHLALVLLILQPDEDSQTRAIAALNRGVPVLMGGRSDTTTDSHRALLNEGALLLTDAGEVIEVVHQAIIDATLEEPTEETAAPTPFPLSPEKPSGADDDDYSLHTEEVEPIDSEEALEILSLGGEIPDVLRQRLKKPEDDE
jgi:DNA processing protein